MKFYADSSGSIGMVRESVDVAEGHTEIPEPPDDASIKGGGTNYEWDFTNEEFFEPISPPEPQNAMREIVAYYASLNQDASNPTKAGRIQLNNLLSAYPGAQGALQAGEYDELSGQGGYLEIAVEDSDLADFDSAMRSDIEDILAGKTSYL